MSVSTRNADERYGVKELHTQSRLGHFLYNLDINLHCLGTGTGESIQINFLVLFVQFATVVEH